MTDAVLFDRKNQLGFITLNRPEALNALNLPMILALQEQLTVWKADDAIKAIVVQAVPGKAFCAGGDIRKIYEAGLEDPENALHFFWHEYRLNHFIHQLGKPYIALMDGITMGGGVGISLHGSHPIAGSNFNFAMPETGIGFFPDIGASYLLMRAPNNMGIYLGLSGERIGALDALHADLVKAMIPTDKLPAFVDALLTRDLTCKPFAEVDACIKAFSIDAVSACNPLIKTFFSESSVEAIFDALTCSQDPWAQKLVSTLAQKSPLSLKITFKQLVTAKGLSLAECLKMDYCLVNHFLQDHDFYEGVRALLVDKDKNPQWQPAFLGLVSEAKVASYFESLLQESELFA